MFVFFLFGRKDNGHINNYALLLATFVINFLKRDLLPAKEPVFAAKKISRNGMGGDQFIFKGHL